MTNASFISVIKAPDIEPKDGDEKDDEEDTTVLFAGIAIIFIIIIIVLILLFILFKKKGEEKEEVLPAPEYKHFPEEEQDFATSSGEVDWDDEADMEE
jgi:hypothetical protein